MRIIKMEGCANDYVFLDDGLAAAPLDPAAWGPPAELARRVADRHRGVGGDGLIILSRGARHPVRMRMWNADGSEGKLCLNGLRCAAKYAAESVPGLGERFVVETAAGDREVRIRGGRGERVTLVEVAAGLPDFRRLGLPARGEGEELWGEVFSGVGGDLPGYGVSVGNPHLVLWLATPSVLDTMPLEAIGGPLALDPRFPEGVNVHLVAAASGGLAMRSWERGTGLTLACGSGAVAAFAVARRLGRVPAEAPVAMPGGTVRLRENSDGSLLLCGPAREVFRADWPAPSTARDLGPRS